MKNKLMLWLALAMSYGCTAERVGPSFNDNQTIYQEAAQAALSSEVFANHRKSAAAQQTLVLDRADIEKAADLAAVKLLFKKEPIEALELEADSTLLFVFPHYESGFGIRTCRSTIIYLPNSKDWYLANASLPHTTLANNRELGNGWFQSDWSTNIAD